MKLILYYVYKKNIYIYIYLCITFYFNIYILICMSIFYVLKNIYNILYKMLILKYFLKHMYILCIENMEYKIILTICINYLYWSNCAVNARN